MSNNIDNFREILLNDTTHFSRVYIKQYHTLRELLQNNATRISRNQTILPLSESLWQTFPDFLSLSNNTDIFRELLAKNTTHFSRVYIKQYWHFQRVPSKLNYSKKVFQSSYQTILTDSKLTSNSTHTFTELLPDNSKQFFESLTGHLNRPKILKRKIPK